MAKNTRDIEKDAPSVFVPRKHYVYSFNDVPNMTFKTIVEANMDKVNYDVWTKVFVDSLDEPDAMFVKMDVTRDHVESCTDHIAFLRSIVDQVWLRA